MTCRNDTGKVGIDEQSSAPLFDNPLRREFLPLEEVARFLGHSPAWVLHRVNEGVLPCYQVGRTQRFFHVDDIRDAIRQNSLALQGGQDDQKEAKKERALRLRGAGQEERSFSLQELRERKGRDALGE